MAKALTPLSMESSMSVNTRTARNMAKGR
jgi:hypothetical protein